MAAMQNTPGGLFLCLKPAFSEGRGIVPGRRRMSITHGRPTFEHVPGAVIYVPCDSAENKKKPTFRASFFIPVYRSDLLETPVHRSFAAGGLPGRDSARPPRREP